MRCFVAIDLPEEIKDYIKKIQTGIKSMSNVKGSFTKEFHLTLKFLGELTPQKVEYVKKNLSKCRVKKMGTSIGRIGVFPDESRIRVVWIGLQPNEAIVKLQKQVDEALQSDFKKEKDFKVHVTVARIKYVADKEKFLQDLKNIAIENKKFEVNEFKLKRSTLTGEGPVYDDLAVYKQ